MHSNSSLVFAWRLVITLRNESICCDLSESCMHTRDFVISNCNTEFKLHLQQTSSAYWKNLTLTALKKKGLTYVPILGYMSRLVSCFPEYEVGCRQQKNVRSAKVCRETRMKILRKEIVTLCSLPYFITRFFNRQSGAPGWALAATAGIGCLSRWLQEKARVMLRRTCWPPTQHTLQV